jgi:hypothetical protein
MSRSCARNGAWPALTRCAHCVQHIILCQSSLERGADNMATVRALVVNASEPDHWRARV